MNKKISIASIFATLMLLVPMTSAVGISDISLNRKIEKIEDNKTITKTYDNEDCGCQVVNRSNRVSSSICDILETILNNVEEMAIKYAGKIEEAMQDENWILVSFYAFFFYLYLGIMLPIGYIGTALGCW